MIQGLEFFCGVDPAPSESHRSDDGAIVVLACWPKQPLSVGSATGVVPPVGSVERGSVDEEEEDRAELSNNPADWWKGFVYGRRLTSRERASARQWSGMLHDLHQRFRLAGIGMDPNQGGQFIKREMIAPQQVINGVETAVTPIGDQVEGPLLVPRGDFIVQMFKRGDPGVEALWPGLAGDDQLNDALYAVCRDAVDHGELMWPAPVEEWLTPVEGNVTEGNEGNEGRQGFKSWSEERQWALKNLDAMTVQFKNIVVATKEDGTFVFTRRNARQFSSAGKKDFVSAGMYAYWRFLSWLRSDDWRSYVSPEDAVGMVAW